MRFKVDHSQGGDETFPANPAKTWTVGYRTGGTENFEWKRTVPFLTREEAIECAAKIERGGRVAYVYETKLLDSIGLPSTYEARYKPLA